MGLALPSPGTSPVSGKFTNWTWDASDAPRPVSVGPGGKFAPQYSPDGSRLAYVVDFDGGENFHIFIQDCTAGQPRDLTPDVDFAIQSNFCWSPDGTQIAFLSNQSGCFSTYVMPASGGEARLLLDNGFPAGTVRWSPDGCWLAVMSDAKGQDCAIFIIPLDGSEAFPVVSQGEPINAHNPAWSPDSKKLAFHSDLPNGFHQIGIFEVNTQKITWLTDGDANCRAPAWSKGWHAIDIYPRAGYFRRSHGPRTRWRGARLPG